METIPAVAAAVQLTGPGRLEVNGAKPVPKPGPRQILARVEAVGLCFSDKKLLDQFEAHVRKVPIQSGIDASVLAEIPSYVPGTKPTVPGHEASVRVVAVGDRVRSVEVGKRYLVQADYRFLLTPQSNATFGYNFEGALQQYVLLDERVTVGNDGESYLLPAPEDRSASSVALAEPWACVEDSYTVRERRGLKGGGRVLVVVEAGAAADLRGLPFEACAGTVAVGDARGLPPGAARASSPSEAAGLFDDILYAGCAAETVEALWPKLAPGGILNLVLGGGRIPRPVRVPLGRIHYSNLRIVGTPGARAADGYARVPSSGEIPPGSVVRVVGAGGPMGMMHVIRALALGTAGTSVVGVDVSADRLAALAAKAGPVARRRGLVFRTERAGPGAPPPAGPAATYTVVMAPVPALVSEAVDRSAPHGVVNLFAGVPVGVDGTLDLDRYVREGLYLFGTSGSTVEDMRIVLRRIASGELDTDVSLSAVSGLAGAIDGVDAVRNQSVAGKIVVYPHLPGLGLTRLEALGAVCPAAESKMKDGAWTRDAETALADAFREPPT
jgi:threonine dehydrogenase-like Zn-dependent dehydrogenase